jgi:hypothetical protein
VESYEVKKSNLANTPVERVLRGGPISGLPIEVNSGIAILSFDHLGLHLSENEHLQKYPVHAFIFTHQIK